jgi:non-specific serine/threonine protein kinase
LKVALASRRTLLVLDNFEHLLEAAPKVSDLLAACPGVDVLATSRATLGLDGEWTYEVPPLRREEAATLLAERAAAVDRALDVTAVADEVCARLDDLPLAIELAAARLRVLTPDDLVARLNGALALLTRGPRDAPERQRTLRATITWSVDLLTPAERALLTRLSIFAGGFSLEASEAACDATLDTLDALVSHSLVRRRGDRFSLLQTIREYAGEMLDESGERDAIAARHLAWFARLGEESSETILRGIGTAQQLAARIALLRADLNNLLAAVDQALRWADLERAAHAANAAWPVCEFIGAADTARTVCQRVVAAVRDDRWSEALLSVAAGGAKFARRQGDPAPSRALWERALRLYSPGHIQHEIARARLLRLDGDLIGSCRCWDRIARGDPQTTDTRSDAAYRHGARWLAIHLALVRGDNAGAVERGQRTLEVVGRDHAYAWLTTVELLARAYVRVGQSRSARALLDGALDDSLATTSVFCLYSALWTLAMCWEQDDPRLAAAILATAEATDRAVGYESGQDALGLEGDFASVRTRIAARIGEAECDAAWREGALVSASAAIALSRQSRGREPHDAFDLSPREREVLLLVAQGCTNAQIAQRLFISPKTVSIHVSRVLAKLGVSSRTQAAAKAHAEGLVEQPAPVT